MMLIALPLMFLFGVLLRSAFTHPWRTLATITRWSCWYTGFFAVLFTGCAVYFQYWTIAAGSLVVTVLLFWIARRLGVLRNRVPRPRMAR